MREEARQVFETVIEYFATIDCEDYMFSTLYPDLKQAYFYQYEPLFV